MNREKLIEAAAKAIYLQRNGHDGTPWEKINTQHREPYRKDVRAVLRALLVAENSNVKDDMLTISVSEFAKRVELARDPIIVKGEAK